MPQATTSRQKHQPWRVAPREASPGALQWTARGVQAVLDLLADSVVIAVLPTLRVVMGNRAACESLGYTREELLRIGLPDIAPEIARDRVTATVDQIARGSKRQIRALNVCSERRWSPGSSRLKPGLQPGLDGPLEQTFTVHRSSSGTVFPVEAWIGRLDFGPARCLMMVARTAPVLERPEARDRHTTSRDELTGLPTRAWLEGRLRGAVHRAQAGGYRFAVLFVDVDRFKHVNDSLGHLSGDWVLRSVAEQLVAGLRPGDAVARYGGDEFVVLLEGLGIEEEAVRVARRISRSIRRISGLASPRLPMRITASIGIAIGGVRPMTAEELLHAADRAMYQAKGLGRDGHWVIDSLAQGDGGSGD